MELTSTECQLIRHHYAKRWWMPLSEDMLEIEKQEVLTFYPNLNMMDIRKDVIFAYANAPFTLKVRRGDHHPKEKQITEDLLAQLLKVKPEGQ